MLLLGVGGSCSCCLDYAEVFCGAVAFGLMFELLFWLDGVEMFWFGSVEIFVKYILMLKDIVRL